MKLLRGLVVLFALAATGPVMADVELYAGVSVGASNASASPGKLQSRLVSQGFNVTNVTMDSEDSGWRFLTGLQFTDIWAVELGFVDLGSINTNVDATVAPSQTAQFNSAVANALPVMPRGLTLAAVARFRMSQLMSSAGPTADKLSFALKLGVIDSDSERKAGGTGGNKEVNADPYYGLVVGWDFSDTWRGVAGFEVFNTSDSTTYWSAGMEFKFPTYQ